MIKTIRDKMKDKKGFTLVELIVVLVILAILAAILVPALLGYIDKAREKQITTNANATYVAAQALLDERYGLNKKLSTDPITQDEVIELTDITTDAGDWSFSFDVQTKDAADKAGYKIVAFTYTQKLNGADKTVYWDKNTGDWLKTGTAATQYTVKKGTE